MRLLYFILPALLIKLLNASFLTNSENSEDQIPLYLSIEVDHKINRRQIFDFLLNNLMNLAKKYPQNSQIRADHDDLIGQRMFVLREPDSWHVTTLYIGDNKSKLDTDYYKKFIEGQEIQIKLLSFAYIPGRLIASPIFIDYDLIENKFAHMTLILGGNSRAVDSNYLLKALFEDNENLKPLYQSGSLNDSKFYFETEVENVRLDYVDLETNEYFDKVYLIKSKYTVKRMIGKTKKNYN